MDAILKGQSFAKYAFNNNADAVIQTLQTAKEKNSNRENTPYTDQDFDDLIAQANRIINASQYGPVRKRLEQLGYELGSDEANLALSLDEYYTRKKRNLEREQLVEGNAKINKLLVAPDLIQALDDVAPVQKVTDNDEYGETEGHTFQVEGPDGSLQDVRMSDREVKLELHKTAAQFIAIAQLLKDLKGVKDMMDFASKNGIAFNKNQVNQSIGILKEKLNGLRQNLQTYSRTKMDDSAEYERQIEDAKTYLLNQDNGKQLADVYRDTALRDLNSRVYTNIIRSIALSTNADPTNKEVQEKSKDMVKRFSDNIQKNKDLQEIVDYYINTEFEDRYNGETDIEDVKEPEEGFENMDASELYDWLKSQNMSDDDLEQFISDKIEQEKDKSERKWYRPFINQKHRDMQDKWQAMYDTFFGDKETEEPVGETVEDLSENPQEEPKVEEPVETEATNDPIITDIATNDQQDVEITPDDSNDVMEDTGDNRSDLNEDEGDTTTPVEDTGDDRETDASDEKPAEEPAVVEPKNLKKETADKLRQPDENAPKKLMEGWYITKNGKIIPSERLYFENGTTVSYAMKDLYDRYLQTAAMIRL